uniref:Uncharacterized protein n=1 Tax=Arundo donax TaxID=35708 RepID=A0A0A9C0A8_ARUDO
MGCCPLLSYRAVEVATWYDSSMNDLGQLQKF